MPGPLLPICIHIRSIIPSVFAVQTAGLVTQHKTAARDTSSRVICMDTSPGSGPHCQAILVCFLFFVSPVMTGSISAFL